MSDISIDIRRSFLYITINNRKDPMTAVPLTPALQDLDAQNSYVVRTERAGKVWNVSVPLPLNEAQEMLDYSVSRRAARLKTTKDAWDRVPQRYFICRIQFEEIT